MEGFVNLFECDDKSGNRPHFKGYIKIDSVDHEFVLWPSKTGSGFSGKYKPKAAKPANVAPASPPDDEIPY